MGMLCKLFALFIIGSCFQCALSSYLGYPRINFQGNFRADSNTHNNDVCHYRDAPIPVDNYVDWNAEGTNEFELVNAKVTSAVLSDGKVIEKASDDPVIDHTILGNLEGPISKVSDGSTRDPEIFSIYGMQFGIQWDEQTSLPKFKDTAFHGDVDRCIITQFAWTRIPCYNADNHGENPYQGSIKASVQFSSTVKVNWNDKNVESSKVLSDLKTKAGDNGLLSIRITLFYTTRRYLPYLPYNGTLGYMVGSIGLHDTFPTNANNVDPKKIYDTKNIQGKRMLFPKGSPMHLKLESDDDICQGLSKEDLQKEKWINLAPFDVIAKSSSVFESVLEGSEFEVQLDLSNSIPTDLRNTLRNIGDLYLGYQTSTCVQLIGDKLDYTSNAMLYVKSGIHVVETSVDLDTQRVVLVQVVKNSDASGTTPVCNLNSAAVVLLEEKDYYVRPMNYYTGFLETYGQEVSNKQKIYVTQFGKPASGVSVKSKFLDSVPDSGPPTNGVTCKQAAVETDSSGVAELMFQRNTAVKVDTRRQYYNPPDCVQSTSYTLPIDGQLYHFVYCAENAANDKKVCNDDIISYFLAFGDSDDISTPNWVDHVHPILSQYARLSPIMTKILDLSNFTSVTQSKELMARTLGITDLDNPSYMPTNRDLSKRRRNMILKWLENPIFDSYKTKPVLRDPKCPYSPDTYDPEKFAPVPPDGIELYCDKEVSFGTPSDNQKAIHEVIQKIVLASTLRKAQKASSNELNDPTVWGNFVTEFNSMQPNNTLLQLMDEELELVEAAAECEERQCSSLDDLKAMLQDAIYLEWSTIPVYLTSLYSIVEGCNFEIYESIKSIVIEEMSHFTQVANTLIAMGVSPKIDDDEVSKHLYIKKRLPGCVLPSLKPTLEELSLEHVRSVFMVIEVPAFRSEDEKHTIGWFYRKINDCIKTLKLSDKDFNKGKGQVTWPKSGGTLVKVNSVKTAQAGLEVIVEQGEGAGMITAQQAADKTYPHFYQFEEIVCQRRLKKQKAKNTYSYTGDPIPFNDNGVWTMRKNPIIQNIPRHSNCYTESRAFHKVYRMLLRKLEEVFRVTAESKDEDINIAIQLMESLQAHAKKLMWTKKSPDCTAACETCRECNGCGVACEKCDACEGCGPVWQYEWPEASSQ